MINKKPRKYVQSIINNEKGDSIIEIVIILAVMGMFAAILFPGLRGTVANEVENQMSTIDSTVNTTEEASEEDVTVSEEAPSTPSESPVTEPNHENLTALSKEMHFNSSGEDQAMRLGRGYSYDQTYLKENIHADIDSFYYLEEDFFEKKNVYFELHGKYYLTTLDN